jgi:hypothetical protein
MKSLEPKYAARAEARARLDRAADAVTRAKRLEAAAAAKAHELEQLAAQSEARHVSHMARVIAEGGLTVEGTVQYDGTGDLALTQSDLSLKRKALAHLELAQAEAQTDLTVAERAVVQAVDQLLSDEIVARARHVEDLLNEAHRLGLALKYFATAAGVHSTNIVPASTLSVLDRLEAPLLDARHVPVDMGKLGDVAAFRDWAARRASLISGDEEAAPKAA